MLKIGLIGLTGRMGKMVAFYALQDPEIQLIGGILGKNLQSLENITSYPINKTEELVNQIDILIDFSLPETLPHYLPIAEKRKIPVVIGTTGYQSQERDLLKRASENIPILYSANFSLGMALIKKLASELARILSNRSSVDIFETHHTQKKDSPSGTSLSLRQAIQPFYSQTIPIHSMREGKIIGEHKVAFNLGEEKIEMSHEVLSRQAFAKGALASAKFLILQKPGLYSIEDVITSKVSI